MTVLIPALCIVGISFIISVIIKEEREKKQQLAFQKAFSKRYNKCCPHCLCLPCQCGSQLTNFVSNQAKNIPTPNATIIAPKKKINTSLLLGLFILFSLYLLENNTGHIE